LETDGQIPSSTSLLVEVVGQYKDGILANALEMTGISEVYDVLVLCKADRETLSYKGVLML